MRPEILGPATPPLALTGGLLAALGWLLAGLLGLPQVFRLPFLALLPVVVVGGAWLATTRARRLVEAAATALLLLVLVTGLTPVLRPGVHALVQHDELPSQPADAIVVLSAALTRDGVLTAAGVERLLHGVALLDQAVAPAVVTTRIRREARGDTLVSDGAQARLLSLAPDSVQWFIVDSVASTHDEAVRIAELARREGWTSVVVVTSPLHSKRACATFRHTGLQVSCSPALSSELAIVHLDSAGDRWRALAPWLHEVVGWWWYGRRGWR
jgi:uncharacterized SAM-binding protein YcdF (DUF218 family)